MFKENCKSPLFCAKVKEKPYNSISKIKSKRIVLPLLHDIPNGNTKEKRSLFSNKTNTSIENKIILKKIDSSLTEYSSPKTKNFISKPNSKRSSRIGIENTYNLKKKNKSNIDFVDFEENSSKRNHQKRFNSHRKLYVKSKKDVVLTETSKKNISFSKLPLIDTSIFTTNDHQQLNKQVINNTKHKFQSEKKLSLNFDFKGVDYSSQTRMGEIENGVPKENNQDSSIILKNVCGICGFDIYGIMDGHGSNGHLVSNFVKNKIKEYFNNKKIYKIKDLNKTNSSKENDLYHIIYDKLKQNDYGLIKNFYKKTNDELYDTQFDIHFSGTTCVLVFKIGKKIICSNVGDSRAIMAERKFTFDEKSNEIVNKYEIIELSHDHKPNIKEEKERIEKSGGEVDQEFLNETDEKSDLPFRVWKKGCDYPGLAVSRSLGDKIAEEIGVISEPEIIEIDINKNSKYIIMGTDGVFEYLTNNDVVEISKKYLNNDNLQKACSTVIEKATKLFKEKENRVDDITINIINI